LTVLRKHKLLDELIGDFYGLVETYTPTFGFYLLFYCLGLELGLWVGGVLLLDLFDLFEVSAAADLFVCALFDDFAPFHYDNVIGELREMDGVRDEDARAAVQIAEQSFADDIVGDVRVDSAE
jgi:hypothetical protein